MSQLTVTLSPKAISELESVAAETHESIESLVNTAVAEYARLWKKRKAHEQLARQYEELAALWAELAGDLADEKWLPVENEALLQFEKRLAN